MPDIESQASNDLILTARRAVSSGEGDLYMHESRRGAWRKRIAAASRRITVSTLARYLCLSLHSVDRSQGLGGRGSAVVSRARAQVTRISGAALGRR